jgi:hypothetical protein
MLKGLEMMIWSRRRLVISGNHHPNDPPLSMIVSMVFASRISYQCFLPIGSGEPRYERTLCASTWQLTHRATPQLTHAGTV